MLFGALIVLGAAFTLKHNRHVRVDLLYSRFSSRYRHLIDFLGAVLLLMLMAAVIGYQSFIDAQDAFAIDERSTDGKIPRGLIYSVIPLGFLLLFLQASVMAVTNFCHICKIKLTDPDQGPDNEAGRAGQ